jgi:G3E family GTPase
MNGVCVRWRGWIDMDRLDGVGCLEYDEERATEEDALLREQIERYNQRLREFEEKQRMYRGTAATTAAQPPHLNHHYHHDTHHTSHHHHHHGHHSRHVGGAGATGATATGIEPHLPHRQDPEMEVRLRAY